MDLKALHASKSIQARPARKRVGRGPGSGLGKTSGRGQKGAGSRAGAHIRDYYEGGQTPLMRRIPKRGFSNDDFGKRFCVLNVEDLNCFDDGQTVDPRVLVQTGIVKQPMDGIKILGDGELEKKLVVKAHRFSKSAIAKITAKGGEAVTMLPPKEMGPKKKKKLAKRLAPKTPKKVEEAAPAAAAAAPAPAEKKAKKKPEGEA